MTHVEVTKRQCAFCEGRGCEECGGTGVHVTTDVDLPSGASARVHGSRVLDEESKAAVLALLEAAEALMARRENCHTEVQCPTCWAPIGVKCRAMPAGYVVGPRGGGSGRELKHPHDARADLVVPRR